MGLCLSRSYPASPEIKEAAKLFRLEGSDLETLWQLFSSAAGGRSGTIRFRQALDILKLKPSALAMSMLAAFYRPEEVGAHRMPIAASGDESSHSHSHSTPINSVRHAMTFAHFVSSISLIGFLEQRLKIYFYFFSFKLEEDGGIAPTELFRMLKRASLPAISTAITALEEALDSMPTNPQAAAAVVSSLVAGVASPRPMASPSRSHAHRPSLAISSSGNILFPEFFKLCTAHPELLRPVEAFQLHIEQRTLGHERWTELRNNWRFHHSPLQNRVMAAKLESAIIETRGTRREFATFGLAGSEEVSKAVPAIRRKSLAMESQSSAVPPVIAKPETSLRKVAPLNSIGAAESTASMRSSGDGRHQRAASVVLNPSGRQHLLVPSTLSRPLSLDSSRLAHQNASVHSGGNSPPEHDTGVQPSFTVVVQPKRAKSIEVPKLLTAPSVGESFLSISPGQSS